MNQQLISVHEYMQSVIQIGENRDIIGTESIMFHPFNDYCVEIIAGGRGTNVITEDEKVRTEYNK